MKPCIFCDIGAKREVASTIYEDDDFVVIMDVYPLSEGHCMVIPKQHVQRLGELNQAMQQRLFELGARAMQAVQACGLGQQGINVLLNDGPAANQTVPHLHLHIIPRKPRDLLSTLPRLALHVTGLFGIKTSRNKLNALAQSFSQHF